MWDEHGVVDFVETGFQRRLVLVDMSPAPAIAPLRSAASNAASSTIGPRAVLIRNADERISSN